MPVPGDAPVFLPTSRIQEAAGMGVPGRTASRGSYTENKNRERLYCELAPAMIAPEFCTILIHSLDSIHLREITLFRASFAPVNIREPWRKCSSTRCNPILAHSFDYR